MVAQPQQQIQGGVEYETQALQKLASNPEFYSTLDDDYQRIQTMEAASPTFASLDDETKQQAYLQLKGQYEPSTLNYIKKVAQTGLSNLTNSPEYQQIKGLDRDILGATTAFGANAVKGASAGYADFTPQAQQFGQFLGADPRVTQSPILSTVGELEGMALPIGKINQGVGMAAKALKLGKNFKAAPVVEAALRGAADLGIYEALKRREGAPVFSPQQLDPLGRLTSGIEGAASGAALGAAGHKFGQVLKSATQKYLPRLASKPLQGRISTNPIEAQEQAIQAAKQAQAAADAKAVELAAQRPTGPVVSEYRPKPNPYQAGIARAKEAERLVQMKQAPDVAQGGKAFVVKHGYSLKARTARTVSFKNKQDAVNYANEHVNASQPVYTDKPKGQLLIAKYKPKKEMAQGAVEKAHPTEAQAPVEAKPEVETLTAKAERVRKVDATLGGIKADRDTLKSRIQELQAEKKDLTGKADKASKDERTRLTAEIKTLQQEEATLKDKKKTLQASISDVDEDTRQIAKTDFDEEAGVGMQEAVKPETQLTLDEVYDTIPASHQDRAKKLWAAVEADAPIRVEYLAEHVGRSNEAVKVTGTGNVKVQVTTFHPTHFTRTQEGKVMVSGYNQRGHEVAYHLAPSSKGSEIIAVLKQQQESAFRGTMPNRVHGQRQYKIADVQNRGPRSEEGFLLTSDAMSGAKLFKELFKKDIFSKLPKEVQAILRAAQKRGRFAEAEYKKIMEILEKDKEATEMLCKLFGLG
jgi:hypothetical protein